MRRRYIDNTKFLSSKMNPQELYAFSIDYEAAIMASNSFFMGLYPPGTGYTLYEN